MSAGGRIAATGDKKGDPPSPWICVFQPGTALKMQRDRHVWATYSCPVSLCATEIPIDLYHS